MIRRFIYNVNAWASSFVRYPGDDQEILLRKKIWLGLTLLWAFFSLFDSFISFLLGQTPMIFINASGFLISVALLLSFYFYRRNIENFGLAMQIAIVVMASCKVYFLDGIFSSSGIATVGLIGPIYALTFTRHRRALLVFFFYLGLILGVTIIRQSILHPGIMKDYFFRYSLLRFSLALAVIFFISMIYSVQIAKLKRFEEERLIQLHHAKSKLYTNITHEFRTPLTIIQGMAEKMEEEQDDNHVQGASLIRTNAYKLLKLVNQLLNMSKLEADSFPVKMIQADIIPYLRYITESFHSMAEEKNIRIHFWAKEDVLIIDFDPDIIEEIISNLLSNAIKFTPQGGNVYLQVESGIAGNAVNNEEMMIRIRDDGLGISADKLPNIFERFYQIDDESTRKAEGSGIGLALVKEYLNCIRGTIQVKSKPSKGTEFMISIPVSRTAPMHQEPLKEIDKKDGLIAEIGKNNLQSAKAIDQRISKELPIVLVIEDNRDVVEYVGSILNGAYTIVTASNGNEGIITAMEIVPDIIICDIMMPEKDGFEVCRILKDDFRTNHIPIILLTAKADMDSKIEGLECGADAYIIKPFHKKELLVRIEKLIESRHTLKDKYGEMIYNSSKAGNPRGLNETFILKITETLENNYQNEHYNISKLCMDVGISRAQLHRKLIALTGKSTSDLIRHYRINKAKELLLATDFTIAEIAYQIGFKDPNYFSKSFLKESGQSPSRFRSKRQSVKQ
jgi:signal transduction histidine kinase/DNA-binding response OmpR family regulator